MDSGETPTLVLSWGERKLDVVSTPSSYHSFMIVNFVPITFRPPLGLGGRSLTANKSYDLLSTYYVLCIFKVLSLY